MNNDYLRIDKADNVVVALKNFHQGDSILDFLLLEDVNCGNKIAIKDIEEGQLIIKYGHPIGKSLIDIKKGMLVHNHNIVTLLEENHSYNYNPCINNKMMNKDKLFVNAFLRKNGEIGIRNELWVVPTVGCINQQAKNIVNNFISKTLHDKIDGIYCYTHPYGCSQLGEDLYNTIKSLQNIVLNPNAAGVLVLGLGCENNQLHSFMNTLEPYDTERIRFLNLQDVDDEIEIGTSILNDIYNIAKSDKRSLVPFSKIKIGLKCGGSDGLSGITANPLIGRVCDKIIESDATCVLTEVPEMFGAEDVLYSRCENKAVFDKLFDCIESFKNYYKEHNQVIYENPSPGNKKGGISTLEEKSLGCIQKAGRSPIVDVLKRTERVAKNGLNIIDGPGNDLIACTTLGMCGCNLILFSTGRGTPFGTFVPTIKISTNNYLYDHKSNWIDFNAGDVNQNNIDDYAEKLFNYIIEIIEGKKTKNEENDFREIAIFKDGVTL